MKKRFGAIVLTPQYLCVFALGLLLIPIPRAKAQTETVLYSFGTDALEPFAGVIMDKLGNLYGTTPTTNQRDTGTAYGLSQPEVETFLTNSQAALTPDALGTA